MSNKGNPKKVIYVDMDDVLCEFTKAFTTAIKNNPGIKFPQSQYGFFTSLSPIKEAVNSVNYLDEQDEFEVYILTAPSVLNPLCYTEKRIWIENYFGMEMVKKLIISPNKGLNKGDYLIDDNNTGRGQDQFEGKLIKFGYDNFKDWNQVIDYFKKTYQLK